MTTQPQNKPPTPVSIPIEGALLHGDLRGAPSALGVVIFVHGSGSSRLSPRNRHVAEQLNQYGLSTLLMDLLTEDEQRIDDRTMEYRFDIPLLAARSAAAAHWLLTQPATGQLPVGLFGASTGAAAALITAAEMKDQIAAVVSRGGRPDLAEEALLNVKAPTLLIVGGDDKTVLALNRKAMAEMRCFNQLHVVRGATHLFEEPGAMEQVVKVSAEWFSRHFEKRESGPQHRAAS
ncbi:MAG TPA: alpha/beta hydrolase [Candidatus Angelobacter sp.]|nr:alpha/beta hydrolase [Candidatus Angelobacter sp.]